MVLGLDFQQLPKRGHTASKREPPLGFFTPGDVHTVSRTCTDGTHSDEVAGVAVLLGGEVVEVSHVLVLGRETARRVTSCLLPGLGASPSFCSPSEESR